MKPKLLAVTLLIVLSNVFQTTANAQWTQIGSLHQYIWNNYYAYLPPNDSTPNTYVGALAVMGSTLYAGQAFGQGWGTARSSDFGESFTNNGWFGQMISMYSPEKQSSSVVKALYSFKGRVYMGIWDARPDAALGLNGNVTYWTDGTGPVYPFWHPIIGGLPDYFPIRLHIYDPIVSFASSNDTLFAVTNFGYSGETSNLPALYYLPNGTTTWIKSSSINGLTPRSLYIFNNTFFVPTGAGVYFKKPGSSSWTAASSKVYNVLCFSSVGTTLFAGTGSGIIRSKDNGNTWTAIAPGLVDSVYCLKAYNDTYLFAGTSHGVYCLSNDGESCSFMSAGLPDIACLALEVQSPYLFVGTNGRGLWRRALSEATEVKKAEDNRLVPSSYQLMQNYPNPFNPSTVISFSLPKRSFVTLKVYDALGRIVSVLAHEELSPGTYARSWNADALPSGMYFYRLEADGFAQTKQMVLLK